jgi:Abortive infection C-terminus
MFFDGQHLAGVEDVGFDRASQSSFTRYRIDLFRTTSGTFVVGMRGARVSEAAYVCDGPEQVLQVLFDDEGDLGKQEKLLLEEAGKRDREIRKISRFELTTDHARRLAAAVPKASIAIRTTDLQEHVDRILSHLEGDPSQAIGSAKDLVEAVAKKVLDFYQVDLEKFSDLPRLMAQALKELKLSADDIPESSKGAESSKRVLSGLNQIVGGVAELRNLYGTGHGRLRRGGANARHARLVVGSAATLCGFVLETLDERAAAVVKSTTAPSKSQ